MIDEKVPPDVTDEERWIVHNRVDTISVEYRQTGTDTAETYLHLKAGDKKVIWLDATFNKVATLNLSWATLCEPKYGVRERVLAREEYEKTNAKELAEYKRLHAKYGGVTTHDKGRGG